MKKARKIKRYRTLYRSSRRRSSAKVWKIVGFVALVAVIIFIGYSVAGPFIDLVQGRTKPSSPESSQSEESSEPEESSPDEPGEETPTADGTLQAVTLPLEAAADPQALSAFLAQAKAEKATAVVLELKDTTGKLHYQSAVEQAQQYGAVAEDAFELEPVAAAIAASGMTPVAKMSAFMDRIAPDTSRNNGYMYKNTTSAWWDNAMEKGGKPWLNPYKSAACDYLLALQSEVIEKGCTVVLWEKIEFPEVLSMASANVGNEFPGLSRQEILNRFIGLCEDAAEAQGAEVFVSYPLSSAFGVYEDWYGGATTGFEAKNLAPVLDLSSFGSGFAVDGTAVDWSSTETAVRQLMSGYLGMVGSSKRVVPVVTDPSVSEAAKTALGAVGLQEVLLP